MDNPNQVSPDSSILGNCLNCQGLVRVPLKAAADSKVRCPHCSNEYRLSEILDESVPALEIVEEATESFAAPLVMEEPAEIQREVFVVPPQLAEGALRKRKRRTNLDNSEESSDSSRKTSSRSSSREDRRSRKKSRSGGNSQKRARTPKSPKSPAIEFIKVVVGGLMAIPIAYAIVLWAFNKDPLNVGPQVSEYVPFVIPADFQADLKSDLNAEN
ncbi:hypothetical protein N9B31_02385 [Mariniblastus sp.]|nr:hypothetical protein [Mariniblastus sp.]MDB4545085.1 hypothetical protein [bacterium]